MAGSVERVEAAARAAGLDVKIERMPESTRTAAEAAAACGCGVAQIVKSMIFEGVESGDLKLILVSGAHDLDLDRARGLFGEDLKRADAKRIRAETGFAIGGVAPIGHLSPIATWMDATLLTHDSVRAAAGAPNALFEIGPQTLRETTGAVLFDPN